MKKLIFSFIFLILLFTFDIETLESDTKNVFLHSLQCVHKEYIKYPELQKYLTENEVISIIKKESNFNPRCVSYKNAKGLMQIMPVLQRYYKCYGDQIFDINENIKIGVSHLNYLAIKYKDKKEILQRYFWGNKPQLHQYYYKHIIELSNSIKVGDF